MKLKIFNSVVDGFKNVQFLTNNKINSSHDLLPNFYNTNEIKYKMCRSNTYQQR